MSKTENVGRQRVRRKRVRAGFWVRRRRPASEGHSGTHSALSQAEGAPRKSHCPIGARVGVDTEQVTDEQKWPQRSLPRSFELRKPSLRSTFKESLEREDQPHPQKARQHLAGAWRTARRSLTPALPLQWSKWPMWFSTRAIITSSRWPRRKRSE